MIGFEEIAAGDYARLSISDTGSGIHSRDLERIYDPFKRIFPAILEEVDSRDISVSSEACRGRGESVLVVDDSVIGYPADLSAAGGRVRA